MKFGIVPVNIGVATPEQMITTAQVAEDAGYESVWTFEHVIVPVDYQSKYPYAASGKMGAAPETPFVDPLIALTAIAMQTKTIRLATGVNIVAQTNALLLAKQAASLDFLSGGRFMLGAGIGWLQEEFVAMGVPYERRGARFDDYMVAMKKVWSGEVVEHESEFLSWHGFKSYPLPVQKPGVPIVMGGRAGKIYERIAKYGDGWFIPGAGVDDLPDMLAKLRAACEVEGRNYDEIELTTMWGPKGGADSLKALADLGVSRVVTIPGGDLDAIKSVAEAHIR
ncbi:MAG: LLM class F420-dependent oxidoreductase [Rhodospirillaceae bacterium]|jgi:probable F420-dependent oxidoreductase|nr:LLM class F420-dependent oxidoreductase [Rhodospirillaceae bacterium]MBT4490988.1 LLM class F420-dependent oxidoreductase [Rhodospirillaceae bacterium]MBT5191925.1 LLM class F420-dependent oxidoreductase [Rhodospirillaceae bacterium]MBT5894630.1 LLM class F420-dependent oxidoreductase [Rhodospirillaceae bacterium]MBT6429274.1 LLM class F420-dependent oxidoreductase [Rhodospirillaceae bacterium]